LRNRYNFSILYPCEKETIVLSCFRSAEPPARLAKRLAEVKETRRDLDLLGWIWTWLVSFGFAGNTSNLPATKQLPQCFLADGGGGRRVPLAGAAKPWKRLKTARGSSC
jgi:hypothetical protein